MNHLTFVRLTIYEHLIAMISFLLNILWIILSMEEILHQLRLVVYSIVYKVFIHLRWWSPDFWTINSVISMEFFVVFRLPFAQAGLCWEPVGCRACRRPGDRLGPIWRKWLQQDGPPRVTHRIHGTIAYIPYLYLLPCHGKCRYMYHTWILWDYKWNYKAPVNWLLNG